MSETEDNERAYVEELRGTNIRAVVVNNDFHNIIEEESGRSSSADYLDTYDDIPKGTARSFSVESNEEIKGTREHETFIENQGKIETERKEATQPAASPTTETEATNEDGNARREETVSRVGAAGIVDGRNENAPVGEWNSLPVLVERLRAALEVSLAQGSRRDDEPAAVPEDSGVDSEEDFRIRTSMERVLGDCKEPELRKDLKFLEDLLLSDIQTALSRLRETLERIDVAALAKNGAASDPTGKLHLLRLVSSLLSRLQVPEKAPEKTPVLPSTSLSRRRRGTRHTIGVSAEELARARKWLEEERSTLPLDEPAPVKEHREQPVSVPTVERKPEEIRDKCVKDAINQRQLLEDKNKEIRESYLGVQQVDGVDGKPEESSMLQGQCRGSNGYQVKENSEIGVEESEERSRVSKLAAALRQRAELAASGGRYGGNKFTAKKSKIKRANTIDIPSYLKLQAESLGHESTGCVSLRRPINVGDKTLNSASIVPSFQPKTENDRKFLALITKNNDAPPLAPVAPFKPFGYAKATDMSSLTNKQWNSRFSNIKTTFDKQSPNEERENRPSLKDRANKWFSGMPQNQAYSNERTPESSSSYNAPMMRTEAAGGFRHAPSSPFRKIEKPIPVSPSKVPTSYHWPKNAPAPTNTLREKARKMFDRDVQAPSKPRPDFDHGEKPSFPRPPWIDHDRGENRANATVSENGRLDYRSFCKQFAPFVGKGSVDQKKFEDRPRDLTRRDRNSGVVDGKISFKMLPDNRVQTHQYPPVERREVHKLGAERNVFEVPKGGRYGEKDSSKGSVFPDATLRGSSSVAVQTGINDEHQDEGRSFRVAPKISKGPGLVCSNASVQTTSDLERPTIAVSDAEVEKQWRPLHREGSDREGPNPIHRPDPHRFVLDHNQNYRSVLSDSDSNWASSSPCQVSSEQAYEETAPQRQVSDPVDKDPREESQDYSFASPSLPVEDSSFPNDENIQNQDISPEVGVVTRYTCAIATVASSVDSPEPRSEAMDSRTSSSPSPSQFSWTKSRPPTSENATPEDEIRRHNLLQQSLVRRLQNEITSLNDEPPLQSPIIGQHLTVDESRTSSHPSIVTQPANFSQSQSSSYSQPAKVAQSQQSLVRRLQDEPPVQPSIASQRSTVDQSRISSHPSIVDQPATIAQSRRQSFSQQANLAQSHRQSVSQSANYSHPPNYSQSHRLGFDQPANFDQPSSSHAPSRFAKFLAPVPQKKPEPPRAHSPPIVANRVGALRDAYEQVPSTQTRPIHKERSPIPNGATPIDSSDEYLVSCATKPSRSIVLSKSESWHQLAISNSYPRAPRVNVPVSTPSKAPSHTKPPKPKSPSSQKLRSKQFEASSMADSVKKMEDKIRQYFDSPSDSLEARDHSRHRRSPRTFAKGMVGLSRSRTMPGISDEKLHLTIPAPQQAPLLNVNTADVDKVFDDLFEEATRTDGRQC